MKIVQIVRRMEVGGAPQVAYLLHQAFRRRGHDAELWFLYLLQPTYAGKPEFTFYSIINPQEQSYSLLPLRLLARLRDHHPDVVITHDNFSSVLGHVAGAMAAVRSRIAVHHLPRREQLIPEPEPGPVCRYVRALYITGCSLKCRGSVCVRIPRPIPAKSASRL